MSRPMHFLIIGLLLLVAPVLTFAQDLAELETDHALTFEFETPHTDWATPYAQGKTRVLFFTDGRGTHPRECVELMQRFDLNAQAVFWARIVDSKESHWHGGKIGEERMQKLLEQDWDCFVFLGISMSNLPEAASTRILEAVEKGAGIVLVGVDSTGIPQEKKRLDQTPRFLSYVPIEEALTFQQGRIVRLTSEPKIEYHEGWEVDYDYWEERLGRAVLWAAKKEPSMNLEPAVSASPSDPHAPGPAPRFTDSPETLTLKISGRPQGDKPTLHLSLRRPADKPISFPPRELLNGQPVSIDLPALPAGDYHADAIVKSSAGVETWTTLPFAVESGRKVKEIKLEREWGEPGENLAGTVTLAGEPLQGESVRVQLLDRRRRQLLRQDLVPDGDTGRFSFEISHWMPMLVTVEAQILVGDTEISRDDRYFRVTHRSRDRFNFLVWDTPTGNLAPYAEESLANTGITLQLAWGNPPLYVSAFDVAWVPYTTHISTPKTQEGVMQPFCWNDKEAVEKHVAALAAKHAGSREHGAFVYSLGDENRTLGCCLSPHCAAAYCKYLQEVYGSLEALNRSWGSDFKAWDNVGLSKEGDIEEENSLKSKNYPRWFDRQAFKSWNYVKYCEKYREAYRTLDPQAKTGFEGAGRFAKGDDLDLIVRSLDFWAPYPGLADEVIRSIAPRGFIRSNWMGYKKDADTLLRKYWRMVTLGMDSVWWWRWDCIGKFHGWLAPDLRPFPAVKEILEDTRMMRDGLGDLLLQSEMQDDGIAILYSYPSTFAHKLDEGASYGGYEEAHQATIKALRNLGLSFRYVTDRMLKLGEFDPSKTKMLILPRAEAIGDKEAEFIRSFVEGGGTVVADLRPGLYDDHCKPREKGVLDDLFGISRETRAPAQVTTSLEGALGFKVMVDPGVRLDRASASQKLGETPLLLSRKFGKGTALLLNCDMNTFAQLSTALFSKKDAAIDETGALREAFAGVAPQISLEDHEGKHPADIQVTRWRNGAMEIIALFRETGSREDVTVVLPETKYIYDLRSRKSLGQQERFSTTILPSRASFFVLSPNPAPEPQVNINTATAARGTVVKTSLSVPGSEGLHALRVRVKSGGSELDGFSWILVVGQDARDFDIPIAFNDPVGMYEIQATDLFSNQTITAQITVH